MKVKHLSVLAGLGGAMILSSAANAAFIGLSVEAVAPGPGPSPGPSTIYHVFANFSSSTDRLNAWGINSPEHGVGFIRTLNAAGTGPGSNFRNTAGQTAPQSPGTNRDYDTYGTIGLRYGDDGPGGYDATQVIPGTTGFIGPNLNHWDSGGVGGGFFVTPDDPQGSASYGGSPNRVLMMQLVVVQGDHVEGIVGISWQAAGQGGVNVASLFFTSVPAPGALALLGLAGVVGSRRRRA